MNCSKAKAIRIIYTEFDEFFGARIYFYCKTSWQKGTELAWYFPWRHNVHIWQFCWSYLPFFSPINWTREIWQKPGFLCFPTSLEDSQDRKWSIGDWGFLSLLQFGFLSFTLEKINSKEFLHGKNKIWLIERGLSQVIMRLIMQK